MGGKSGGPLSSWIREFITLVFVQTVQAFIFAIIMILILPNMDPARASSGDDYNAAVGVMCVFALTSLFKVEEMVRKIFGLGGTKADHKGALQSIAKTAFALQLGKRVLDNGKKLVGGASKIKNARTDKNKANKRLSEDMNDLGLTPGNAAGTGRNANTARGGSQLNQPQQQNGSTLLQTLGTEQTKETTLKNGENVQQLNLNGSATKDSKEQLEGNRMPDSRGLTRPSNESNAGATRNNNVNIPSTNLDIDSGDIFNSNEIDLKTKQKLRAVQRTAEDALKNAKKARNEGIKDIAKGLAESAGAVVVGPMGAILGGAEGNIDDAINGLISGVGLGDAIGEKTIDAGVGIGKFAQNRAKNLQNLNTDMQDIKRAMETENKSFSEAIRTKVQERTGAIRDLEKNTEDLKKYLDNVKIKANNSNNTNKSRRSSVDDV